ncbi:MAG: polysaccharide ABC transporter ATP-binding protein [Acidobacteriota bacterium]|nr:polysaccharide ABC transporter ATP-binding protein [Acidobacteriota bacterium]
MSEVAIRVEGVSKQYRIGVRREKYKTLRDSLVETAAAPFRRMNDMFRGNGKKSDDRSGSETDSFWALKDVSFDIKCGEVVGVIGRNGAGKSTLLKVLSRITEPTEGFAEIHGRVGALLEVGTGFHQELTGRENVFLNGAILGMRREEIARKFDEIVEFAEVGKFIDTPVKRYSSGMHLRLAFSVAAHLEPEILLVDEVLAVGDVAFQKKCVGKMEDVASQGRTVLFVSHNLAAIKELCQTSVVMNNGQLDFRGPVVQGLAHYGQLIAANPKSEEMRRGTYWHRVRINGHGSGFATTLNNDDPLFAEAEFNVNQEISHGYFFCIINDATGNQLVHQRTDTRALGYETLPTGTYNLCADFPTLWLAPGVYTVHFKFVGNKVDGTQQSLLSERLLLDVIGKETAISRSLLAPPLRWTVEPKSASTETAEISVFQ